MYNIYHYMGWYVYEELFSYVYQYVNVLCYSTTTLSNPAVKKVYGTQEGHCEKRCEIQGT